MKIRGLWGLEIEPQKVYDLTIDASFKITMASIYQFNGPERTSVRMEFQELPFLLCSLIPEKIEQQVIDITCLEGEKIIFRSEGPNGIHLMGNYISQGDSESEEEEEEVESRSVTEEYSRIEVEKYSRTADEDTIMPGWDSIDVLGSPDAPIHTFGDENMDIDEEESDEEEEEGFNMPAIQNFLNTAFNKPDDQVQPEDQLQSEEIEHTEVGNKEIEKQSTVNADNEESVAVIDANKEEINVSTKEADDQKNVDDDGISELEVEDEDQEANSAHEIDIKEEHQKEENIAIESSKLKDGIESSHDKDGSNAFETIVEEDSIKIEATAEEDSNKTEVTEDDSTIVKPKKSKKRKKSKEAKDDTTPAVELTAEDLERKKRRKEKKRQKKLEKKRLKEKMEAKKKEEHEEESKEDIEEEGKPTGTPIAVPTNESEPPLRNNKKKQRGSQKAPTNSNKMTMDDILKAKVKSIENIKYKAPPTPALPAGIPISTPTTTTKKAPAVSAAATKKANKSTTGSKKSPLVIDSSTDASPAASDTEQSKRATTNRYPKRKIDDESARNLQLMARADALMAAQVSKHKRLKKNNNNKSRESSVVSQATPPPQ